jgi:hypothetical protein
MTRSIVYDALVFPVTRDQVREFKRASKAAGNDFAMRSGSVVAIIGFLLAGVVILFIASSMVSVGFASFAESQNPVSGFFAFFPLLIIAAFVLVGVHLFRNVRGWEKWMRLTQFAAANGLTYSVATSNPQFPGSIFALGRDRQSLDHVFTRDGRYLEIGNYRYVTGSGKNQTTHNWGFMALQLDRKLPHMVLDSTANNGLFGGSNLPTAFAREQRLSLEGDFDKYFSLYAPKDYERDALYVFTPDLMALLIDEAAPFDVEIIDDWMFVYSSAAFVPADPGHFQRLFRIADTVGEKTLSQTDRYADDRIGDPAVNLVAPQGARLKSGISVGTVIAIIIVVVGWGWTFFGDLFG